MCQENATLVQNAQIEWCRGDFSTQSGKIKHFSSSLLFDG